jgi:hypothetical protein
MTSRALRIYTAVIALICGAAVTWSIHQGSIASAWQADARSWHTLAAQAVVHDRLMTRNLHVTVARYDRLIVRTRRSQHKLLDAIAKARAGAAAQASLPATPSYSTVPLPAVSAPAPVPVAPAPAPATQTSPVP